ncbi:MAG: DnaJ domain-containing protein [Polyangiales bacterium]
MPEPDPLEQLDYYDLLELDEGVNADEVRRAFHRFAAKYHPDKWVQRGADAKTVERAAEIYRRGAEAYKVLTHPQHRRSYDAQRAQGQRRFDPNAEPPAPPARSGSWPVKVKSPLARPFATKAEQAYKAGDFGTAKVNLRMALSKDPGNAQIAGLLADVEAKLAGQ